MNQIHFVKVMLSSVILLINMEAIFDAYERRPALKISSTVTPFNRKTAIAAVVDPGISVTSHVWSQQALLSQCTLSKLQPWGDAP